MTGANKTVTKLNSLTRQLHFVLLLLCLGSAKSPVAESTGKNLAFVLFKYRRPIRTTVQFQETALIG